MKCCNMKPLLLNPMVFLCWSLVHVHLIAVMCAMIGSKCITAHCSCIWPKGRSENVIPVSSTGCEWLHTSEGFAVESCLSFWMSLTKRSGTKYPCLYLLRWLFHETTCTVYAFCGVLFGLSSLSNLTALSCVCWLKVCCPNYGKATITNLLKVLRFTL